MAKPYPALYPQEFRKTSVNFIPFSSWIIYIEGNFWVLYGKIQGINLAKSMKYELEQNLWIYLI